MTPGLFRSRSRRIAASLLLWAAATAAAPPAGGEIAGTTIDGHGFSLRANRGHVVLVNFWATWCGPCRAEMPALDAFYRAHHAEGFDMVAVSLDGGLSRQALARATGSFAFPVARIADIDALPRAAPTSLPVTWIYGRDGAIRFDSSTETRKTMDPGRIAVIVMPLLGKDAAASDR